MANNRHLRTVTFRPNPHIELPGWTESIPAVQQLIDQPWEVPSGVTFLVGENGSGKSTIVEALAQAYPRLPKDLVGPTSVGDESPLGANLHLACAPMASTAGFFLRAEAMHGYLQDRERATNVTERHRPHGEPLARSHGEGFLWILQEHFWEIGVYFLDEPEAALSFTSCIALMAVLGELVAEGSQAIIATHSPLLTALPGATIYELGDWGWRETSWAELDLVRQWRGFLQDPQSVLRHLG